MPIHAALPFPLLYLITLPCTCGCRGVSYAESASESSDGSGSSRRGGGRAGKRGNAHPIAAFDGPGELEVERVLGHRWGTKVGWGQNVCVCGGVMGILKRI